MSRDGCRWIEGDAKGASTAYCCEPCQEGSSYCAAHHARAYQAMPLRKLNAGMGMDRTNVSARPRDMMRPRIASRDKYNFL